MMQQDGKDFPMPPIGAERRRVNDDEGTADVDHHIGLTARRLANYVSESGTFCLRDGTSHYPRYVAASVNATDGRVGSI